MVCSVVLCCACFGVLLFNVVLSCIAWYFLVLYWNCDVLHSVALYYVVLCCSMLDSTVMDSVVLCCVVL